MSARLAFCLLLASGCATTHGTIRSPRVESSIRFVASYPATLLYALDAAAGERNRDAGYRAWLLGDEAAPWLEAYGARRRRFGEAQRPDAGGGAPAYEVCAWEAKSVDELVHCAQGVVGAEDRALVATALHEADRRLAPRWAEVGPRLTALLPHLDQAIRTDRAVALLHRLREEAGLRDDEALRFHVVLVGKPPGPHTFARQQGQYLVHEVADEATVEELLTIAFHEVAHLAHHMSPRRAEMERAFSSLGDTGRLAAGVWDEVVATAFGNGLAAATLDPRFRVERSFYTDHWIDTLGHALYRDWAGGLDVKMGPALAQHLTRLVERDWPERERTMSRHLWYVTVYAQDRMLLREVLRGVDYRSASRMSPIDDAVPAGPELPPCAPRVVLVTAAELGQRPALVARAHLPPVDAVLGHDEAAVFRHDDADGTPLLVVIARDAEALRAAASRFTQLPRMVTPGWTALPRVAAAR